MRASLRQTLTRFVIHEETYISRFLDVRQTRMFRSDERGEKGVEFTLVDEFNRDTTRRSPRGIRRE